MKRKKNILLIIMKQDQKPVLSQTKQLETERLTQSSVPAGKYPRLKEIDNKLKDQNKVFFEYEKKRDRQKTQAVKTRETGRVHQKIIGSTNCEQYLS